MEIARHSQLWLVSSILSANPSIIRSHLFTHISEPFFFPSRHSSPKPFCRCCKHGNSRTLEGEALEQLLSCLLACIGIGDQSVQEQLAVAFSINLSLFLSLPFHTSYKDHLPTCVSWTGWAYFYLNNIKECPHMNSSPVIQSLWTAFIFVFNSSQIHHLSTITLLLFSTHSSLRSSLPFPHIRHLAAFTLLMFWRHPGLHSSSLIRTSNKHFFFYLLKVIGDNAAESVKEGEMKNYFGEGKKTLNDFCQHCFLIARFSTLLSSFTLNSLERSLPSTSLTSKLPSSIYFSDPFHRSEDCHWCLDEHLPVSYCCPQRGRESDERGGRGHEVCGCG